MRLRRRERVPIGGRREAEGAAEAGGEGADAPQADREADVGDRAVGVAQQRGGPLEAAGQQVGPGRLAEGFLELAAEVGAREAGRARHVVDAERLGVAGVGEVLGAEQVSGGRYECHPRSLGSPRRWSGPTPPCSRSAPARWSSARRRSASAARGIGPGSRPPSGWRCSARSAGGRCAFPVAERPRSRSFSSSPPPPSPTSGGPVPEGPGRLVGRRRRRRRRARDRLPALPRRRPLRDSRDRVQPRHVAAPAGHRPPRRRRQLGAAAPGLSARPARGGRRPFRGRRRPRPGLRRADDLGRDPHRR